MNSLPSHPPATVPIGIRNPRSLGRIVDSAAQQAGIAAERQADLDRIDADKAKLLAALADLDAERAPIAAAHDEAADLAHDYTVMVLAICDLNSWARPEGLPDLADPPATPTGRWSPIEAAARAATTSTAASPIADIPKDDAGDRHQAYTGQEVGQ